MVNLKGIHKKNTISEKIRKTNLAFFPIFSSFGTVLMDQIRKKQSLLELEGG